MKTTALLAPECFSIGETENLPVSVIKPTLSSYLNKLCPLPSLIRICIGP